MNTVIIHLFLVFVIKIFLLPLKNEKEKGILEVVIEQKENLVVCSGGKNEYQGTVLRNLSKTYSP